jgi:hypothetical protein
VASTSTAPPNATASDTSAAAGEPSVTRMPRGFLTREFYAPVAEVLGGDDVYLRLSPFGSRIVA